MITYLTLDQAIEIHSSTIKLSGGGVFGILNMGQLSSVLESIQNDIYYPTFEEKITHLFFGACQFHCFQDGNKRIAITLTAQMLLLNGYMHCMPTFFNKMENISYHVASGKISKELLGEIIAAIINREDEEEALKFKIWQAIQ